jgi:hypothetical protein
LLSAIAQFETSFFFDPGLLLQSIKQSRASSSSLIDQSRLSLLSVPWPLRCQIHHLRLTIQSIKQPAFLSLLFPQMHTELHQQRSARSLSLSRAAPCRFFSFFAVSFATYDDVSSKKHSQKKN